MELGDVIASFRKKKNIDQKELAAALGITVTYISLIENNRKKPSPTLLKSVADYFGVPVSVLLFNALKDTSTTNKKYQDVFKVAEPLINRLVDFLISEKDAQKTAVNTKSAKRTIRKAKPTD